MNIIHLFTDEQIFKIHINLFVCHHVPCIWIIPIVEILLVWLLDAVSEWCLIPSNDVVNKTDLLSIHFDINFLWRILMFLVFSNSIHLIIIDLLFIMLRVRLTLCCLSQKKRLLEAGHTGKILVWMIIYHLDLGICFICLFNFFDFILFFRFFRQSYRLLLNKIKEHVIIIVFTTFRIF